MYAGQNFDPFDQVESYILGVDFTNDLPSGDTVSSGTWTITVADNSPATDPSPTSRLVAGPFIESSTIVAYRVSGCLPNVKYCIQAVATTALGNTISLFTYLQGETVT